MSTSTTTSSRTTTNYKQEYGSSSTTTRVRAHEETEIHVQLESLRESYRAAIGSEANVYITDQAERLLRQGVPYEYFAYALQETAFAPRPSWRYTMAIINRLMIEQEDPHSLVLTMSLRD